VEDLVGQGGQANGRAVPDRQAKETRLVHHRMHASPLHLGDAHQPPARLDFFPLLHIEVAHDSRRGRFHNCQGRSLTVPVNFAPERSKPCGGNLRLSRRNASVRLNAGVHLLELSARTLQVGLGNGDLDCRSAPCNSGQRGGRSYFVRCAHGFCQLTLLDIHSGNETWAKHVPARGEAVTVILEFPLGLHKLVLRPDPFGREGAGRHPLQREFLQSHVRFRRAAQERGRLIPELLLEFSRTQQPRQAS